MRRPDERPITLTGALHKHRYTLALLAIWITVGLITVTQFNVRPITAVILGMLVAMAAFAVLRKAGRMPPQP